MHGNAAVDPDEQVLTTRGDVGDQAPGEVDGGEPWNTKIAARENPSSERSAQPTCVPPDNIPLRHDVIISDADRVRCGAPTGSGAPMITEPFPGYSRKGFRDHGS